MYTHKHAKAKNRILPSKRLSASAGSLTSDRGGDRPPSRAWVDGRYYPIKPIEGVK